MLLANLRTHRTASGELPMVRYDPDLQISLIREGDVWIESWRSSLAPDSKKADLETGEDEKGR